VECSRAEEAEKADKAVALSAPQAVSPLSPLSPHAAYSSDAAAPGQVGAVRIGHAGPGSVTADPTTWKPASDHH